MKKKVLWLLILFTLSVVWFAAWLQHVQAYNQMKEDYFERFGEHGDYLRGIVDFYPVWDWENGPLLLATGFIIATLWTCTLHSFYLRRKKLKNE